MRTRRKFIGLLLGGVLGAGLSLKASKSHALFGIPLTPEELFEKFIEQAGGVLMRFLGNRSLERWKHEFDKYTENSKKQNEEASAGIAQIAANATEANINALQLQAHEKLKLNAHVSPNACVLSMQSQSIQEVGSAVDTVSEAAADRQVEYLKEGQGPGKIALRNEFFESMLNEHGHVVLKELPKLFTASSFTDAKRAERELALLLSDLTLSTGDDLSADTLSTEREKIRFQAKSGQTAVIINALSQLVSQRLPAVSVGNQNLDNYLSDELKSRYSAGKLSYIELLQCEVDMQANNPVFRASLQENPSLTSGLVAPSFQLALTHKLQTELIKTKQLNQSLFSLSTLVS